MVPAAELPPCYTALGMTQQVDVEELRRVPFAVGLTDSELVSLRQAMHRLEFEAGETVLREGESNDTLLCLLAGRLEVRRQSSPSDVILAQVEKGTVLGELTFLEPGEATATAVAIESGAALTLSSGDFTAVEKESPALAASLYRYLALTLKLRLEETTELILAQRGIHEAVDQIEDLRRSLAKLL